MGFRRPPTTAVRMIGSLSSVIGTSLKKLDNGSDDESVPVGLVGAILPYANHKPCNRFTVVNFKVTTKSSCSPLQNLKHTQHEMSRLITSPNGYINYTVFKILGKCPSRVIQFRLTRACTPTYFSNLPCAAEKVKLFGVGVENVYAWMPLLTTAGVGVLTLSYHDTNTQLSSWAVALDSWTRNPLANLSRRRRPCNSYTNRVERCF